MQTQTVNRVDPISGTYELDTAHSRIGFVARHAMITKVRGSFNDFEGTGFFDVDDPSCSWLGLTIQAASIDTRNADRDEHLRSNDFFAMDEFPTIEFASTEITQSGQDDYRVIGDLTIRGVTRPVAIDFEYQGDSVDPDGDARIGFEGRTVVNRKDFGVSWNESLGAGGVLVGDNVVLEFDVSAVRTGN